MLKLKGANMDVDLFPNDTVSWDIDACPWNKDEDVETHKCAIKNISLCQFFKGIEYPDIVICGYEKGQVK